MGCQFCNGDLIHYCENGLMCTSCNSILVKNPPTKEELVKYYDSFLDEYHGGGREDKANIRQEKWANEYHKRVLKYSNCGKLLDIGPANNPFPNISSNEFSTSILDFKKPLNLENKIRFFEGSLNDDLNINDSFDVITCWALLEHVLDVNKSIRFLSNHCKTGGYVHITTPLSGSFADMYGAGNTPWFFPPEHIYLISPIALEKMFDDNNFDCIEMTTIDYSKFRNFLRNLLIFMEGFVGIIIKKIAYTKWKRLREKRKIKNIAVTYAVFKKR